MIDDRYCTKQSIYYCTVATYCSSTVCTSIGKYRWYQVLYCRCQELRINKISTLLYCTVAALLKNTVVLHRYSRDGTVHSSAVLYCMNSVFYVWSWSCSRGFNSDEWAPYCTVFEKKEIISHRAFGMIRMTVGRRRNVNLFSASSISMWLSSNTLWTASSSYTL